MKNLLQRYGPWAVITGASSGIGEQFAKALASAGLNLVIAARRIDRLDALKQALVDRHRLQIVCVQVDLSQDGCLQCLSAACAGLEIGLLVNNAGSGTPGPFVSSDIERQKALVRLNCVTPLEITRHFLPQMQARRRGGIIFLSSLMGFQGVPYMANYSATKGYLLNFGEALFHECRGTGIDVLVLAPGATDTPGRFLHPVDYSRLPISWMSAEQVVDVVLRKLGRKSLAIPGARNHLAACMSSGLWSRGFVQGLMKKLARLALPAEVMKRLPMTEEEDRAKSRIDASDRDS